MLLARVVGRQRWSECTIHINWEMQKAEELNKEQLVLQRHVESLRQQEETIQSRMRRRLQQCASPPPTHLQYSTSHSLAVFARVRLVDGDSKGHRTKHGATSPKDDGEL